MIHVLARANESHTRPAVDEQCVPALSGFCAEMEGPVEKSRALFHMTYPNPPNKTIINDVMFKLAKSIQEKNMPFAVITGDHPVYVLILELKSENSAFFNKILHIQMSFINAIYKRFKGSGIADILIAAGVIANGSVDQALKGRHFKLFYEALIHQVLSKQLESSQLSKEIKTTLQKLRESTSPSELQNNYLNLENNSEMKRLIQTLTEFEDAPLSEFWVSFLEVVEILTQNIHSIDQKTRCHLKTH